MDTSVGEPSSGTCSSMIVSVRLPSTEPVESSFCCSSVRPARLSLPTMSTFIPDDAAVLSGGSAATVLTAL